MKPLRSRRTGILQVKEKRQWESGICFVFADAHLSDDKTVAKIGHPVLWLVLDVGHQ
jgi:hypothetical protein